VTPSDIVRKNPCNKIAFHLLGRSYIHTPSVTPSTSRLYSVVKDGRFQTVKCVYSTVHMGNPVTMMMYWEKPFVTALWAGMEHCVKRVRRNICAMNLWKIVFCG
jgi:hypothetical protein